MRSHLYPLVIIAVATLSSLSGAQLVLKNGVDIDMSGSAGSQIIFPDGTAMDSASAAVVPDGHGGMDNAVIGTNAFIGGGSNNSASGHYTAVGGGDANDAGGEASTIGGGASNTAFGWASTIGGGILNEAYGRVATVGGGAANAASGYYATVPGGLSNTAAGDYSFAAGHRAIIAADHDGTFLFADETNINFNSASANEFAVRAKGGVRFITNSNGTAGQVLRKGGSTWESPSSKSLKENMHPLDTVAVLEKLVSIPVEEWNYIHESDGVKHYGPYAEDFHAAFGLNGEYDGRIASLDVDGVALAAIQGLNRKLEEASDQVAKRDSQIAALAQRLDALEAKLAEQ